MLYFSGNKIKFFGVINLRAGVGSQVGSSGQLEKLRKDTIT